MAKKTLGYVELEWTCTRCGTVNPGTQKTCTNCGAAMGDQEQFELPEQQTLITEEEAKEKAAQGPDIHCPYCGTRNPGGAKTCSQCGGDLAGAQARQSGQVMGAYRDAPAPPVPCPACGTPNPAGAARCSNCGAALTAAHQPGGAPAQPAAAKPTGKASSRTFIIVVAVLAVVCLAGALLLFSLFRTQEQTAVVQSVQWQRSVEITEERPVEHQAWMDQIPSGAQVGACQERQRSTQLEPAPNAVEVCGTPYTVDQGSGVGEVVQDCEYQVYDDWCEYTQLEWVVVAAPALQGADMNPQWPVVSLTSDQREGDRLEEYRVIFRSGDDTYTYSVESLGEFARFAPGSEWVVEVNALGGVSSVSEK